MVATAWYHKQLSPKWQKDLNTTLKAAEEFALGDYHQALMKGDSLDPAKVASQVRRLLISLLPSGKADQELIAARLNRSSSTLQRQLQSEGLTYRSVLEDTRRSLAEDYLKGRKHSHAQIAYLLGFSDQSNFSRAFKRWTRLSPREYQDTML